MAGRNSKPKNRGPASHPGRLDQFGDKLADGKGPEPKPENVLGE
ncbi:MULTISPECIES: hypothetical protein [Paenibacillus]|nr:MULTISPECIES: hypothetical protein [Paenibacillus]EGL18696.1 hypothetical protein HMPREF9413_2541 [Paenibacillus sp. HGF7]EPD92810.1 hypothetical protein HMPREF1207_00581 [Paenibacillus sp. HGH0039]MEC0249179.1 hypothetical protein [Paenibacillus chitinolyticus]SEF62998.1 hypothetical protein SAMN02799616_00693 [Paenibacillus sp. UNC499MF]